MKYKNIPYEKKDINIILKFAEDYKISILTQKKDTEIVKYPKDSIIGTGVGTLEIIQIKGNNDIKHYLFFKSFQMNNIINQQYVFYDKNILNDEKIGIDNERLNSLNISYEVKGKIVDITDDKRCEIEINDQIIDKFKKHIKSKLQKKNINEEKEIVGKKEVDKIKKEKQVNKTEII
jgi:hypothetical protein